MRLAHSWFIMACIAATVGLAGADNALAQASIDRQAVKQAVVREPETLTESRDNRDAAAEEASAAADVAPEAGQDRSNVGPIRWMAPESLSEKAVAAPDAAASHAQTRDRDDEGRTQAAGARRILGEPCGIPPVASDPTVVAGGAVSTPGAIAATQGCGDP